MQYYLIEWEEATDDETWELYLEIDRHGCQARRVEVYRAGLYQAFEAPYEDIPVDPAEEAQDGGKVYQIDRNQFENIWNQSREVSDGLMGMFF